MPPPQLGVGLNSSADNDRYSSDSDDDSEQGMKDGTEKRQGCCKRYGKAVLRFMFSHVGLCILISCYCVGGAYLFRAVEIGNEKEAWKAANKTNALVESETERVIAKMKRYNKADNEKWSEFDEEMRSFSRYLNDQANNKSWVGDVGEEFKTAWNFPSALLYAVSIITLIGYGHINVATEIGQVLVIVYALLGIPLMLMFLTNIGELLARGIRFTWGKISCHKRRQDERERKLAEDEQKKAYGSDEYGIEEVVQTGIRGKGKKYKVRVPIWLTMIILTTYIFLGSLMFYLWEKWNVVKGIYFCIVTLTTTGFGDLIPGWSSVDTLSGQFELAMSSLYIIVGLAFLSMGFNLVIEEVLMASKKVGKVLGLHNDKDEKDRKLKSNLDKYVRRKVAKI